MADAQPDLPAFEPIFLAFKPVAVWRFFDIDCLAGVETTKD